MDEDLGDLEMIHNLGGLSRLQTDPVQQQQQQITSKPFEMFTIPSLVPAKNTSPSSTSSSRSTRRTKHKFPPNRTRRSGPEFCVECGVGHVSSAASISEPKTATV